LPAPDEPGVGTRPNPGDGQRQTVRVKVSRATAPFLQSGAPRDLKLAAARGQTELSGLDLATGLFYLGHNPDPEIKETARQTLRRLPGEDLARVLAEPDLAPQLVDFIVRHRLDDLDVLEAAWVHPLLAGETVSFLGEHAEPEVLVVLLAHPEADSGRCRALQERAEKAGKALDQGESVRMSDLPEDVDEEALSKYQVALELGVPEKIKMALTGDKEWRTLFLRDSNKMVSTAALKNPRITEGEVLMVARNRTANDELIRLINVNREWLKNLEIKKALIVHPRTPMHKALKYMSVLTEKEIKFLAKSKSIPQVIVNNARRMLLAKQKKR